MLLDRHRNIVYQKNLKKQLSIKTVAQKIELDKQIKKTAQLISSSCMLN
jgi:hypothetical protein